MTRAQWNLLIDALALLAFLAMLSSGWIMQFDLPHGSPSRGWNVLGWDRHGWGELHEMASLAFIGLLVAHFVLHWEWVLCMSKGGSQAPLSRKRAGLLVLGTVLVLTAIAATAPFILPTRQGSVAAGEGHGEGGGQGRH
jgi:hypothetical protein